MRFYIKKIIEAKSFNDAIKREATGEIIDIWKDEPVKQELTPAVGFDMELDCEEDTIDKRRALRLKRNG